MTTQPSPYEAAFNALLTALSQGLPSLLDRPGIDRHTEQALGFVRGAAGAGSGEGPSNLTLDDALHLVKTGQALLEAHNVVGVESPPAREPLTRVMDTLERELGAAMRHQQADKIRGLYVIIDPEVTAGREPIDIAKGALRGGARILQLRDKLRDKGEILPLALELLELCRAHDALLIINDHVDLAATIGPDSVGVHVGQTDLPVANARKILHPQQVLGRSNREIHLLVESQEMGADHVAFGAIYQTGTKPGGREPQGAERVKEARAVTQVPLVCIGGITADNVGPVVEAGADAICVAAAVGLAPEPEAAAAKLVEAIRSSGGKV